MSQTNNNNVKEGGSSKKNNKFWRSRDNKKEANTESPSEPDRAADKQGNKSSSSKPNNNKQSDGSSSLQPRAKSTTFTSEKNDPLAACDFFTTDGIAGFQEARVNREFRLDFSTYLSLVRASYHTQIHYDRGLAKYVSLSMWQYYCIIMLWKRLWRVVSDRGLMIDEYLVLASCVGDDYAIPSDINLYLSGVGDIIDQDGRLSRISLNANPNHNMYDGVYGFFGRLDHLTHAQYETIPSPGIALLRIIQDLRLTYREDVADWNIPLALRAEEYGAPTCNLLGWDLAVRLTDNQRDCIGNAGLVLLGRNIQSLGCRNVGGIPVNIELMAAVSQYLKSSKTQFFGTLSLSRYGSMAQIPYTDRSSRDNDYDRFTPIGRKTGIPHSVSQMAPYIAQGSMIMRYRLRRMTDGEVDGLCWHFRQREANPAYVAGAELAEGEAAPPQYLIRDGDPPANWIATQNTVFDYGQSAALWNTPQYSLGEGGGVDALLQFCETARSKVTRR